MVYNRRFHFPEVQYAKIFFDCIGSMREHLRDVTIEDTASFEVWNARPILLMLQDARALQGLRFSGHLGRTLDPLDVAKDPTRIARAVSPLVKRVGQPLTASTQRKLSWMLSRLR